MAKTIKVAIGETEYSLSGDDEEMLFATADKVNEQFKKLIKTHGKMPEKTIAILAALNIAESDIKRVQSHEESVNYLRKEINQMSEILSEALE